MRTRLCLYLPGHVRLRVRVHSFRRRSQTLTAPLLVPAPTHQLIFSAALGGLMYMTTGALDDFLDFSLNEEMKDTF